MRFLYGVHGFGRGHAMRALGVLPRLSQRHVVRILAGGDAYDALSHDYDVARIPVLAYHHAKSGRISNFRTLKRNLSMVMDLLLSGSSLEMVEAMVREFSPDVIITDSEAFTHRAAEQLGIPRISFDHFGFLVYCKPAMSFVDRVICAGNAFVYRTLFKEADRLIISCFFDAPLRRADACLVGPVIRPEVRTMKPVRGEHLLAYINRGEREYTPRIEQALLAQDCPVRLYGTPHQGRKGNIEFKPIANLPFIEDLASCKAVFGTTGNQLLGEVMYFRKPMLGMPMACLEQRLNAAQLDAQGVGMRVRHGRVTAELVRSFLARLEHFESRLRGDPRNGEEEAFHAIERFACELSGAPSSGTNTAPIGSNRGPKTGSSEVDP